MSTEKKSNHGEPRRGPGRIRLLGRATKWRLTVAVFVLPTVVATALFVPRVIYSNTGPGKLLEQAGYLVMNPPSRFHGPGTLNTVESFGNGALQLHPTCELNDSALHLVPVESETVDQSIRERLSGSFDVSSRLREKLDSTTFAETVKSVNVTFKNMRILLMSHEKLLELQGQILNGSCEQAILYNIDAGARVCQTEAVLQADMVYTIEYRDGVSSSQQVDFTKEIASKVDIEAGHTRANEITGEGLFYGIKLMPRCIELQDVGSVADT